MLRISRCRGPSSSRVLFPAAIAGLPMVIPRCPAVSPQYFANEPVLRGNLNVEDLYLDRSASSFGNQAYQCGKNLENTPPTSFAKKRTRSGYALRCFKSEFRRPLSPRPTDSISTTSSAEALLSTASNGRRTFVVRHVRFSREVEASGDSSEIYGKNLDQPLSMFVSAMGRKHRSGTRSNRPTKTSVCGEVSGLSPARIQM